jgi:hypothetical protein
VWFTTRGEPEGHGLENPVVDKKAIRLEVDIPDSDPALQKWALWAPRNCHHSTIRALHKTASGFKSWFIYFGHVPPEKILRCVDVQSGRDVPDWRDLPPHPEAIPPTPFAQRDAWHARLMFEMGQYLLRYGPEAAK